MGKTRVKNTFLLVAGALVTMLLLISMLASISYGATLGATENFYRKQTWSGTPYTLLYYSKSKGDIAYCLESGVSAPQTSSGSSFSSANAMFAYYLTKAYEEKKEEYAELAQSKYASYTSYVLSGGQEKSSVSATYNGVTAKVNLGSQAADSVYVDVLEKSLTYRLFYATSTSYTYNCTKPYGMPSSDWEKAKASYASAAQSSAYAKIRSMNSTIQGYISELQYANRNWITVKNLYNKFNGYGGSASSATTYKYVKVNNINANGDSTLKNKIVNQESNIKLVLSRSFPIISIAEFKSTTGYSSALTELEFKLAVQQAIYTLTSGKRFRDYETASNVSQYINQTRVKEVTAILLSGITSYTGHEDDDALRKTLGIDYSTIDKNSLTPSMEMKAHTDKIIKNEDGSLEKTYTITYYGKTNTTITLKVNNNKNAYLENKPENVVIICDNKTSTTSLDISIKPNETKTFTVKVNTTSDYGKLDKVVTATASYKKLNDVMYLAAQNGYGYYSAPSLTELPSYSTTVTVTKPKLMDTSTYTTTVYPGAGGSSWVSAVNIQDLVSPTPAENAFSETINFEWLAENGSISFKKVDQDGKLVNGAIFQLKAVKTESNDLSNADFSLVDVVDEGPNYVRFTNKEGKEFKINKLPLGEYSVSEAEAPIGYIKSGKTYSAILGATNNNVEITGIQDDLTKGAAFVNRKIVMDLSLEKWVDNVKEENGTKTYDARNKYDADVEKRAGNIYVKEGDIVTYTIRIFNHGNVSATAEELTDTIANGLEFVADNETNKKYGWYVGEDGKVHTNYLKNEWLTAHVTNGTAHNGLNYHSSDTSKEAISCDKCNCLDVQISFKVKNLDAINKIINVAEITKYKSAYDGHKAWTREIKDEKTGEIIKQEYKAEDIDSSEKNHPDKHNFENEANSGENGRNEGDYYREDDEDIAVVIPQRFDLGLEKWVSQVIRKDEAGTEKNIYTNGRNTDDNNVEARPGDIQVRAGDTVIYTIRVYNHGNIDGYAQEIMDSAPEGLEFINPESSQEVENAEVGYDTNKLYLWKVSDGVLKTTFLSRENEQGPKTEETAKTEANKEETATDTAAKDETAKKDDVEINLNAEEQQEQKAPTFIELMQTKGLVAALKQSEDATKPEAEQSAFYKMYKDGTKLDAHIEGTSHVGYNYNKGEKEAAPCEKCDYKDLQIAFRVADDASSKADKNGRIINLAQIDKALSEAYEKTGDNQVKYEELKDIDSTPGNHGNFVEGETREDDEDIAVIIPETFDLALRKWITSYIKTVDGKSETVKTTQDHSSTLDEKSGSKLVKIDLDYKKLASTEIKINYGIRVENQGNIPGYVKELTDYLPYGTEFYVEDNLDENGNPNWVLDGDVLITSEGYEDEMNILMNPGDTQMFYLTLRWINGEENMGLKTNTVEISKDHNEWNTPDKDSTPGNILDRFYEPEKWEDEEDAVPFLLTVRTGEWMIRFGIIIGILGVVLAGLVILRKRLANRI